MSHLVTKPTKWRVRPAKTKSMFEKFARIFSRRHKQTTFSDVGFLGALRVDENIRVLSGAMNRV